MQSPYLLYIISFSTGLRTPQSDDGPTSRKDPSSLPFLEKINSGRENIIHPRKWSILLGFVSTLLGLFTHYAITFKIQEGKVLKEKNNRYPVEMTIGKRNNDYSSKNFILAC